MKTCIWAQMDDPVEPLMDQEKENPANFHLLLVGGGTIAVLVMGMNTHLNTGAQQW